MWPFKRKAIDENNVLLSKEEMKELISKEKLTSQISSSGLQFYCRGFTLSRGNINQDGVDATINGIDYKLKKNKKDSLIIAIPKGSKVLYYAYK